MVTQNNKEKTPPNTHTHTNQGAERPLANDPMVLQALGYQGAAIGDELDNRQNLQTLLRRLRVVEVV